MRLQDAIIMLEDYINRPLGSYLSEEQLHNIIRNKGKSGQLLEIVLGLRNTNCGLDFDDGELKTNKCDSNGNPKETMFIMQICTIIDDLINERDFYSTHLYNKMSNMLYVPISKDGDPHDWKILTYVHVNLESEEYHELRNYLEQDYYLICTKLKEHIENSEDGYIHTSSGKFIQIRSKDSKPYHPIYSGIYEKNISNKNHAFYFKKDFMRYITQI